MIEFHSYRGKIENLFESLYDQLSSQLNENKLMIEWNYLFICVWLFIFLKCPRISCLIEKAEANNVRRKDSIEKHIPKLVGIFFFFWGAGCWGWTDEPDNISSE